MRRSWIAALGIGLGMANGASAGERFELKRIENRIEFGWVEGRATAPTIELPDLRAQIDAQVDAELARAIERAQRGESVELGAE